jgi:peptidoglycan hydrolase-like protein with peptidoglycan-binding domain
MAGSARQRNRVKARGGAVATGAAAFGAALARNPAMAGGSTALVVATVFVAANALWYQPHAHRGAFFATRDFARPSIVTPEPETTFLIERPAVPQPAGDPTIAKVQEVLGALKLYEGALDGLPGPATARAVERYRATVGLPASAAIDQELLVQLGLLPTTSGISPAPRPIPREVAAPTTPEVPAAAPAVDERVRRIQAGLRAFGSEAVDVDGLMGPKTRSAIRAFQTAQGLEETGEADDAVYGRMRELGLIEG